MADYVEARRPLAALPLLVSAVAVSSAFTLSLLLRNFIEAETLCLAAVVVAAWFGGRGAGLIAAALATLAFEFIIIDSSLATLAGVTRFAAFGVSALLVSTLSAQRRSAERDLRRMRDELEVHVSERTAELALANQELQLQIAERERADELLRHGEARYRNIFQTVGVSIWEEDFSLLKQAIDRLKASGVDDFRKYLAEHPEFIDEAILMVKVVDVNEATLKLFNAGSKNDLLISLHKVFVPETRAVFAGELIAVAEGRRFFEAETELQNLNGEKITALFTIAFPPADASFSTVLVTITDVTERKRAAQALRDSEEQWRAVFENNPTMYFMVDVSGMVLSVNPYGAEQLGYTVDEIVGRSVLDVFHEDDKAAVQANAQICVEHIGIPFTWEFRKIRKNGTMLWVRETARALLIKNRPVILIVCEDITERMRAAEALREAQAELAHVTRATTLGELTASIAHEVNQPLAAVVMSGNACQRWLDAEPPNLEEVRQGVRRIIDNGNRASAVIRRVRSMLERQVPEKTSVDVNEIIRDTVALTRGELARHHVSIRTELGDRLPSLTADRVGLQQVLVNLILNGVDAMSGTATLSRILTIRSRYDETQGVIVEVQDRGKGFEMDNPNEIFAPFFSTKPGGLGLGLSISRSIVEAHQGRLWATQNAGPGATVQFALPLQTGLAL